MPGTEIFSPFLTSQILDCSSHITVYTVSTSRWLYYPSRASTGCSLHLQGALNSLRQKAYKLTFPVNWFLLSVPCALHSTASLIHRGRSLGAEQTPGIPRKPLSNALFSSRAKINHSVHHRLCPSLALVPAALLSGTSSSDI